MQVIAPALVLFSVLVPSKVWFAANQPLNVKLDTEGEVTLLLTEFTGRPIEDEAPPEGPPVIRGGETIDLYEYYPPLRQPGTYILYAVPKEAASITEFAGTPLVISVRQDLRRGAPPGAMVVKVDPLSYAVLQTEKGEMRLAFYYDVAPNNVGNFVKLAREGFYDGLTFHRIVPSFVIQGGDPRGDGTGGPGYMVDAEFSDRPHEPGTVSMARSPDPNEPAARPAAEYANSAGSQFFICLDYNNTRQLDRRYTAFAKVVSGMNAVDELSKVEIADAETGRPQNPPVIQRIEVRSVTAKDNPYPDFQAGFRPAAQDTGQE
jgi:cyclophilin family peptidyl-prolyl cis-trans isomerase